MNSPTPAPVPLPEPAPAAAAVAPVAVPSQGAAGWAAPSADASIRPLGDAVAPVAAPPVAAPLGWEHALEAEAQKLLATGQPDVWDVLNRRFESQLIRTALVATHGRRMEAAQRLGIGRNTITRKIQELGLDAADEG